MQPQYFCPKNNKPVYYSLQNPTLLESTPKAKQTTSTIETTRNLKELIDYFIKQIPWQGFEQSAQPFCEMINKTCFDFFHSDTFAYGSHIRPSTEIPKNDEAIIYDPTKNKREILLIAAHFLKICVRITNKSNI